MKTLITGGTGLVGKAIQSISTQYPNHNFTFLSSSDCDLTDFSKPLEYFKNLQPDYVIHLAACVGGLYKNMNYKVDMLEKNLTINYNVLKCCHLTEVKKCVSCLSTCIFPDKTNAIEMWFNQIKHTLKLNKKVLKFNELKLEAAADAFNTVVPSIL